MSMSMRPYDPDGWDEPLKPYDPNENQVISDEKDRIIDALDRVHGSQVALNERQILRPWDLEDFIGQERVKSTINTLVNAAKMKNTAPPHILIQGPAGHGKTTLANIVAHMRGVPITNILASSVKSSDDLVMPISTGEPGRVVFLDEIHRLTGRLQEVLYPIMEDFIIREKGDRYTGSVERQLLPFCLIGATTDPGKLTKPLKDRFGVTLRLTTYESAQLVTLIKASCKKINLGISDEIAEKLSARARFSPRQSNHIITYCRDVAILDNQVEITQHVMDEALDQLGIDSLGLSPDDRQVLFTISESFGGGPVGVESISLVTDLDTENIQAEIEPILLRLGLVERTTKGRKITEKGLAHTMSTVGY